MKITDVEIDQIITGLHRIAVDYDSYEHGLPVHSDHESHLMMTHVREVLDNVQCTKMTHTIVDRKELREFFALKGIKFELKGRNLIVYDISTSTLFNLAIEFGKTQP